MTTDEKPESSHEFNFFLDRQLQNKLIDLDEELFVESYHPNGNNALTTNNSKNNARRAEEITSWNHDHSKTNFRKPEKEFSSKQKDFIQPWRDYNKQKLQQSDNFVFKHYADIRHYIEQYREEFSNCLAYRSPVSNDIPSGDVRRHLNNSHHSAPTPTATSITQQNSQTQNYNHTAHNYHTGSYSANYNHNHNGNNNYSYPAGTQLITASLQPSAKHETVHSGNTTRTSASQNSSQTNHPSNQQCGKHTHVHVSPDNAYKYKLAPEVMWRSESFQSVIDTDKYEPPVDHVMNIRTPRLSSAKGERGKSPTKVMVPGMPNSGIRSNHTQSVTV